MRTGVEGAGGVRTRLGGSVGEGEGWTAVVETI